MRWARGVLAATRAMAPIAVPLMGSAAAFDRRGDVAVRATLLIGLCSVGVFAAQVAMAYGRPASLEIRKQPGVGAKGQPLIDALGLVAFLAYLIGWLAFLPLDAARLHLLTPPVPWIGAMGLLLALLGCALGQWALWDNAFASPAVQTHAGQEVIRTGAYRLVRHPLYAGNLFLFAGMALWIGSLAGFLGVGIILLFSLARILVEERHLRESLPGYGDYTRAVRGRVIPFLL